MTLDRSAFFIDGGWAAPATTGTIQVVSPHSEQVVATVPEGSNADIDAAVAAARRAFDEGPWPRMSPEERIEVIQAFSMLYAGKLAEMAELITIEMGSPTSFANLAQSPAPWMQIESFLAIAREFAWEETRPGALGGDVIVRREPVGVVAAIPPWNVPQFTTISKVVPALLAGNTVVVKPAPETPLDTYLMAELLARGRRTRRGRQHRRRRARGGRAPGRAPGHRQGRVHRLDRRRAQDRRRVRRAAEAGVAGARRQVGRDRPRRRRPRRHHGGPEVRRPDELRPGLRRADPDPGVAEATTPPSSTRSPRRSRACASGTRPIRPPRSARWSPQRQQERVEKYIALGQEEGARVVVGGNGMPDGLSTGWYVRPPSSPTSTTGCGSPRRRSSARSCRSSPYDDVDDAVRIANDSDYGLAGTVWTADQEAGLDVARRVRAGTYGVNTYTMDFAAPSAASRTPASAASSAPRAWRSTPSSRPSTRPPPPCSRSPDPAESAEVARRVGRSCRPGPT